MNGGGCLQTVLAGYKVIPVVNRFYPRSERNWCDSASRWLNRQKLSPS